MSLNLPSGEQNAEAAYFAWLEGHVRDMADLREKERELRTDNPDLFRIIADSAAELSIGDPRAHATNFGTFLLMLAERPVQTVDVL